MRPPILQWKVMLALVGVVLVAVTLGSALRPTSKPATYSSSFLVIRPFRAPRSIPPAVLKSLLRSLPKRGEVFVRPPEHKTIPDRLRAWLDKMLNK
jgi:hypothetical protein